ncbi:hypothetical protein [Nannocystis radixulma]|uniref:Uncharacterized protein n=1 Tax=Nannocystis radixulma TaxID=2995305 RepID=A0ABT5B3C6_9BACT|nr:hypothetical protein [Nannocystis radixulma]MDC0668607.1 hypothetical protein [Nannocystis radixulma]
MASDERHDLAARAWTEELLRRLQAFCAGQETHESLQAWARTAAGGPAPTHRIACEIHLDLWNAASRLPPGDPSCPYILRPVDVVAYARQLQRGAVTIRLREFAVVKASLPAIAAQLGLESERHVLDGLGWFESLQFASPGSGRVFVLSRPLQRAHADPTILEAAAAGPEVDARDLLRDLFETLGIDLADVLELPDGFDPESLPKHTLWRQDDNGNRFAVATFTGLRKAEAALQRFLVLKHKQFYWLEDAPA